MKMVLLASHVQLARSLNLWHDLAGTVNKLKLPLQANPALYVSSQLWTCHLFLLYGIFKSIEKSFTQSFFFFFLLFLFFPSPIFWTLAHRQIIQAFSDFEKKKKRQKGKRETLSRGSLLSDSWYGGGGGSEYRVKVLDIRWELRRWGQALPMAAAAPPPPPPRPNKSLLLTWEVKS